MKLIDKDAVLAEIERRKNLCEKIALDLRNQENKDYYQGKGEAYSEMAKLVNTEAKEVDLQSEIDRVWDNTSDKFSEDGWKEFEDIAKHFFELGMSVSNKAQKGE